MPKRNKPAARGRRSSSPISAKSLDQTKTRSRLAGDTLPLPESEDAAMFMSDCPTLLAHDPNAATLPVPDAATLDQFLKEAGHVWHKAHWDTVIKRIYNTPVVSWPGKSRHLEGGINVVFRKTRFGSLGYDHLEMWLLIPENAKIGDIKKSARDIIGWRKRLTEAQGKNEGDPFLLGLIHWKKQRLSYQDIADKLNSALQELLRKCDDGCDERDSHLDRWNAQFLLARMGYEHQDQNMIQVFLDDAMKNIRQNRNPFAQLGPPISGEMVINVLKPFRKEFSPQGSRSLDKNS